MKLISRILCSGVVALGLLFVLFAAESSSARARQFRVFDINSLFIGQLCIDGAAIGLGYAGYTDVDRKLELYDRANAQTPLATLVMSPENFAFRDSRSGSETAIDNWNGFCSVADHVSDGGEKLSKRIPWCGGPFYLSWEDPVPPGTVVDVHLLRREGDADWADASGPDPNPLNFSDDAGVTVGDCLIHQAQVSLAQVSPRSTESRVSDALVFEAQSYDPSWPNLRNGEGIASVGLSLLDATGNVIIENTDSAVPYCLLGEDEEYSCDEWNFAENNYEWPSRESVTPGPHRLRAVVVKSDGYKQTAEWLVDIERTYWQHSLYIPYAETGPWVSIALPGSARTSSKPAATSGAAP